MSKTCKKLLASALAAAMLISTFVSTLVVSAATTGTLAISTKTITVGTESATVDFTLTFSEAVEAPHELATIVAMNDKDEALTITDVALGDVTYADDYVDDREDLNDPELEVPALRIKTDGINKTAGKVIFESGVDGAVKASVINFTVIFDTTNAVVGTYTVTAVIDSTNLSEEDIAVTATDGAIVVEEEVTEPAITYTFGHTMQLKLIEPWGLFFNAAIRQNGVTVDYSTLSDYGMYILRADTQPSSVEELINADDVKVFKKGDDNVTIDTSINRVKVTYDDALYTYEMENKYYAVFYAVDPKGNVSYGDIKERSMRSVIDSYLDASSSYSEELIDLCNKLITMYDKTVAYRNARPGAGSERLETTPDLLGNCSFGAASNDVAYKFGHTMQLTTIEPWGLIFNGICRLDNVGIDYEDICSEYGVIIYTDVDGKYDSAAPTNEELLSEDTALVYNNLNNSISITDDGKISIDYTEGIYTYQMDQKLYAAYYVVVDGKYYYGDVKTRSMMTVANSYLNASSGTYADDLLELLNAMIDLYNSTTTYRNSVS